MECRTNRFGEEWFFSYYMDETKIGRIVDAKESIPLHLIASVSLAEGCSKYEYYISPSSSLSFRAKNELITNKNTLFQVETPERTFFLRSTNEDESIRWAILLQRIAGLPGKHQWPLIGIKKPQIPFPVIKMRAHDKTLDKSLQLEFGLTSIEDIDKKITESSTHIQYKSYKKENSFLFSPRNRLELEEKEVINKKENLLKYYESTNKQTKNQPMAITVSTTNVTNSLTSYSQMNDSIFLSSLEEIPKKKLDHEDSKGNDLKNLSSLQNDKRKKKTDDDSKYFDEEDELEFLTPNKRDKTIINGFRRNRVETRNKIEKKDSMYENIEAGLSESENCKHEIIIEGDRISSQNNIKKRQSYLKDMIEKMSENTINHCITTQLQSPMASTTLDKIDDDLITEAIPSNAQEKNDNTIDMSKMVLLHRAPITLNRPSSSIQSIRKQYLSK